MFSEDVGEMVAKKRKNALNENTLAIVGLYDETYALYCELDEIYQSAYRDFHELNSNGKILWPNNWDRISRPLIRKALDKFLVKNTFLFTQEFEKIHPTAPALNCFSMLDTKITKPLTISVKIISFSSFLSEMEMFVFRILFNRKRHTLPKIDGERVFKELEQHIIAVSEQYRYMVRELPESMKDIIESELTVFESLSLISCNQQHHTVEPTKYYAELLDGTGYIALPAHRCQICERLFIGRKTLDIYQKAFGRLFVKLRDEQNRSMETTAMSKFRFESELHCMGYNVVQGKMSIDERRALLIFILENNKLTYYQICRDIERCISIFHTSLKHSVAIDQWESDLMFLGEYIKAATAPLLCNVDY